MNEIKRTVKFTLKKFQELSEQEQALLKAAKRVRKNAQAPYSKFAVGVAVLSAKGTVHVGCNVERCSWSQTTHAEQNAIDSMVAEHGSLKVEMVVVVAAPVGKKIILSPENNKEVVASLESVTFPCGHCLQIIWENCYNDPTVKIIGGKSDGTFVVAAIADLLPVRFGPKQLGIDYSK